jgi:hypothetical protein
VDWTYTSQPIRNTDDARNVVVTLFSSREGHRYRATGSDAAFSGHVFVKNLKHDTPAPAQFCVSDFVMSFAVVIVLPRF